MENAHAVQLAFERVVYEESTATERASDVNVVSTYLTNIEVSYSTSQCALNHYQGEADKWFRRASELDDDARKMRAEVRQAKGELAAVAQAARALCDRIASQDDLATLIASAADLRRALQGEQTDRVIMQIQESVKPRDVTAVVRRMLRKMRVSDKMAQAAESWLRGQIHL